MHTKFDWNNLARMEDNIQVDHAKLDWECVEFICIRNGKSSGLLYRR
jgi:hypothetical protein